MHGTSNSLPFIFSICSIDLILVIDLFFFFPTLIFSQQPFHTLLIYWLSSTLSSTGRISASVVSESRFILFLIAFQAAAKTLQHDTLCFYKINTSTGTVISSFPLLDITVDF